MKIVFVHIPKTAGSSISKALEQVACGLWLRHGELENTESKDVCGLAYLGGHFRLEEFYAWHRINKLSLDGVKILAVIRHPLDQLQSNLSFPFELSARGVRVEERWMLDVLEANPQSASDLCAVLSDHPWLFNLQWQYLVSGSWMENALDKIDQVAIFPDISNIIGYAYEVLEKKTTCEYFHENISKKKYISRDVFANSALRQIVLDKHSLDIKLFIEVVRRHMHDNGLSALDQMCSFEPEWLIDCWIAGGFIPLQSGK